MEWNCGECNRKSAWWWLKRGRCLRCRQGESAPRKNATSEGLTVKAVAIALCQPAMRRSPRPPLALLTPETPFESMARQLQSSSSLWKRLGRTKLS